MSAMVGPVAFKVRRSCAPPNLIRRLIVLFEIRSIPSSNQLRPMHAPSQLLHASASRSWRTTPSEMERPQWLTPKFFFKTHVLNTFQQRRRHAPLPKLRSIHTNAFVQRPRLPGPHLKRNGNTTRHRGEAPREYVLDTELGVETISQALPAGVLYHKPAPNKVEMLAPVFSMSFDLGRSTEIIWA